MSLSLGRGLKEGLPSVLGKRIVAVLGKERDREPRAQVFLIFDDGTSYEFFGEFISGGTGLDTGGLDEARRYMGEEWITFEHQLDPNADRRSQ